MTLKQKLILAAAQIVPLEKSTAYIPDPALKQSCTDFFNFKNALYNDMNKNPDTYFLRTLYSITSYNELLLYLLQAGSVVAEDVLLVDMRHFQQIIRNRGWRDGYMKMLNILNRLGVVASTVFQGDALEITSKWKMWRAAKELVAALERYKNNKREQIKYFRYCEFRALDKSFRRSFDTLIETLDESQVTVATKLNDFALANNLKPVKRVNFNNVQYNYKSERIMYINTENNVVNVTLYFGCGFDTLRDEVMKRDSNGELTKFLFLHILRCSSCNGLKNEPCGKFYDVDGERVMLCMLFVKVDACEDWQLPYVMQLMDIEMYFWG